MREAKTIGAEEDNGILSQHGRAPYSSLTSQEGSRLVFWQGNSETDDPETVKVQGPNKTWHRI